MKVLKKLWLLIILLLICILLIFVTQIYAKYLSSAAGDTNMAIAKWNILVNNHSIKNNTDISYVEFRDSNSKIIYSSKDDFPSKYESDAIKASAPLKIKNAFR